MILSCHFDLRRFPFDEQVCPIQLSSCEFLMGPTLELSLPSERSPYVYLGNFDRPSQ